jgi:hypothetical protein
VFRQTAGEEKVFLRVIDYPEGGEYLDFDFLTLVRDSDGEWALSHRRSLHTALPVEMLQRELAAAGFDSFEALGGHDGRPLDLEGDESVVLIARRQG